MRRNPWMITCLFSLLPLGLAAGCGDNLGPPVDRDADGYDVMEDCDDDNPDVHPDAQEICDQEDNDCDGAVDDADTSVDPSNGVTYYEDADQDGHGDEATRGQACVQPAGSVAEAGDCDDDDAAVHPGATESCNSVDDDCSGAVDDADVDDSGQPDCKEIAIIPTAHFEGQAGTVACLTDTPKLATVEIEALEAQLEELGFYGLHLSEGTEGVPFERYSHTRAVIVHNGGYNVPLLAKTEEGLADAAAAGKPVLLLGDDLGYMASNAKATSNSEVLLDLANIAGFQSNGASNAAVTPVPQASHPVLQGPAGTVGSFTYSPDLDQVTLTNEGETVLMTGGADRPAVWVMEKPAGTRVAAVMFNVYYDSVCTGGAATTVPELEKLFKNAMSWLLGVESGSGLVFVTSETFTGNLGGLDGADALCQDAATAAGLPGTYTAWLSTATVDARDRITNQAYVNKAGQRIADSLSDLTAGNLQTAIRYDETGEEAGYGAWTGTQDVGTLDPFGARTCDDWTSAEDIQGVVGNPGVVSGWSWGTTGSTFNCGTQPQRLYCFQD